MSNTNTTLAKLTYEIASNNTLWVTGINDTSITSLNFDESPFTDYKFIIQTGAFKNASNLTSITLSSNVQIVESFAFDGCKELTEVTITNSTISLGFGCFNNCDKLTTISGLTFSNNLPYLGYLFGAPSYDYSCNAIIPSTLTTLTNLNALTPYCLANCNNITRVNLKSDIEEIPEGAFYNCTNLHYFSSDKANYLDIRPFTNIGYQAFFGCPFNTVVARQSRGHLTTDIKKDAFRNCFNLVRVCVVAKKAANTISLKSTEAGCIALYAQRVLSIAKNTDVEEISEYFVDNDNNYVLFDLPDHEKSLTGTLYLTDLISKIPGTNDDSKIYLADNFGIDLEASDLVLDSRIVSIGDSAFKDCKELKQVSFRGLDTKTSTPLSLGKDVFKGCTALQTIDLDTSLDTWKNISFSYPQYLLTNIKYFLYKETDKTICVTLETENRPSATEYTTELKLSNWGIVPVAAFMGGKFFDTVKDNTGTIEQLAEYSFYNCENLADINNCQNLSRVEMHALDNCKLQSDADSDLIIVDEWICGVKNSTTTKIRIPKCNQANQPFKFAANAFTNCAALEEVYFDGTINDWLNLTFTNSWSNPLYKPGKTISLYLKTGNIWEPWNRQLDINLETTLIKPFAFSGASIEKLTIADNTAKNAVFNNNAFFEAKITEINIDCSLLKTKPFNYCSGITHLQINSSDTNIKIPDNAFKDLNTLRIIRLNGIYAEIGNNAFIGCNKLHTVYFNNSFANTEHSWCKIKFNNEYSNPCSQPSFKTLYCLNERDAYYAVNESLSLSIEQEEYLNAFVFLKFNRLTSILLDASKIRYVDISAFYKCLNLRKIIDTNTNPSAATKYSFKSSNVGSYIIEKANQNNWKIIYGTSGIINIVEPEEPVNFTLTKDAFIYSKVQELIICNAVTKVEAGALSDQLSLKKLSIPFIGPDANADPTNLGTDYHFKYLFGGKYSVSSITLPSSLQLTLTGNNIKIGTNTFFDCYFSKLAISGNLTYLAENGLDRDNIGQLCFNEASIEKCENFQGIGTKNKLAVITKFINDTPAIKTYYIDAPYIYKNAFSNMQNELVNYKFICKESVLGIHSQAFSRTALRYLFLPKSLKYLNQTAFLNTSCYTLHLHSKMSVGWKVDPDTKRRESPLSGLSSIVNIQTLIMPLSFYELVRGSNTVNKLIISKIDADGRISDQAFQNWKNLETVIFRAELNLSDNTREYHDPIVKKIGKYAFKNCSKLINFPWTQLNTTCIRIDDEAFRGCSELTQVQLPSALNPVFNTTETVGITYFAPNIATYYFRVPSSGTYQFISDDFIARYRQRKPDNIFYSSGYSLFNKEQLTRGTIVEIQLRALTNFDKVQPKFYLFGSFNIQIGVSSTESNILNNAISSYWRVSTPTQLIPRQNLININKRFNRFDSSSSLLDTSGKYTKNKIFYTKAKFDPNYGIGFKAFEGCLKLATVIDFAGLSLSKNSTDFGYVAKYATTIENKRIM